MKELKSQHFSNPESLAKFVFENKIENIVSISHNEDERGNKVFCLFYWA